MTIQRLARICAVVLISSMPAAAQVIWQSNFGGTGGLTAWDTVQCGAVSLDNCPASSKWYQGSSGGWQANGWATSAPLQTCAAGSFCRFLLQSQAPDGTSGPFLRIETHGGSDGDRMWSGFRDELVWNAECDPQTGICDNLVGQDRYYAWRTFIPNSFPAIPSSGSNWHVLFQMHEVGACSGNGPPLTFGLKNYESSTPYQRYKFVLTAKSTYGCDDDLPIWEDNAPLQTGMTHSFILHAHFAPDNTGYYELWIDGIQRTDPRMLNRATLYIWPAQELTGCAAAGCDAQWYPSVAGHVMGIGLKYGNYHTFNSTSVEVIYHSDLVVGQACEDVTSAPPAGCSKLALPAPSPTSSPAPSGTSGPVWVAQSGTAADEYAYGAATDANGNVYVAGYSSGTLEYSNSGGRDAVIQKYDPNGNKLWGRQLGNTGDERAFAAAVDPSGNVLIAGSTSDALYTTYQGGAHDAFVAKYDANGNRLWIKVLGTGGDDIAYGVASDGWGNVFLTGSTTGSLGYTASGGTDVFVVKLDPNGNTLWKRQLGSSADEVGQGVAVDKDGSAILCGWTAGDFGSRHGGLDGFIAKYTTGGDRLWVAQLGTSSDDVLNGVAVGPTGNITAVGSTRGSLAAANQGGLDLLVVQYAASGSSLWVNQAGSWGDDEGLGVAVDTQGSAYVAGSSTGGLSGQPAGGYDAFVAKYGAGGDRVWLQGLGSPADEVAKAVAVYNAGPVYVAGGTFGALGKANAGGKDLFLAKF